MKNLNKNILLYILIIIFTIGIVPISLQNDTFFNISIGKYILQNGIDMQEHFCYADSNLYYSYSHWLFDIIAYLIYNLWNFAGIYICTIIFSSIINITLFTLLYKRNHSYCIALVITFIVAYLNKFAFTMRSQLVSFLGFIIILYCIEKFIETNRKKYAVIILVSSIVIANFHAAAWALIFLLFMPYLGAAFLNHISFTKNISPKIIRRSNYNVKNLIILLLLTMLTGLLTPLHGVPYTYIIKSMFGASNFNSGVPSISYIDEMKPPVLANSLILLTFIIFIFILLVFLPTKIKSEHGLLLIGLVLMAICSNRYCILLCFLSSFVFNDIIVQILNLKIKDEFDYIESAMFKLKAYLILLLLILILATPNFLTIFTKKIVDKESYPVEAVNYIKANLDYKNMRIYNSYNVGSYLMFNDIPVFIDSRLDVYCSEFNDTDIFKDFIYVFHGFDNYKNIFDKYQFTHILLQKGELIECYISYDSEYNLIYEDENFVLYEKI